MSASGLNPAVRKGPKSGASAQKLETDTEFRVESVLFCAGCKQYTEQARKMNADYNQMFVPTCKLD